MATKKKINMKAIEGAIKSANTPMPLKRGLIKKYGKKLGLTKAEINKYLKSTKVARKVAKKVKAKKKTIKKNPTAVATKYIVTSFDKNKGMRTTISKSGLTKSKAEALKKSLQADMKNAIPAYRWASAIKVERVKKNPRSEDYHVMQNTSYGKGSQYFVTAISLAKAKASAKKLKHIKYIESFGGAQSAYDYANVKNHGKKNPPRTSIKKVISKAGKVMYYIGDGLWFGRTSKAQAEAGLASGKYTMWETVDVGSREMWDDLKAAEARGHKNPCLPSGKASMKDNPQVLWKIIFKTSKDIDPSKYVGHVGIETPVKSFTVARKTGFTSRAKATKWAKDTIKEIEKKIKSGKWDHKDKALFNPPLKGSKVIYEKITALEATKGSKSLWPKEPFRHDFKKGGKVIGLADGDLLIKRVHKNKPLWKEFEYGPEDGTRKNPVKKKGQSKNDIYIIKEIDGVKVNIEIKAKSEMDAIAKYKNKHKKSPSWDAHQAHSFVIKKKNPSRILTGTPKLSGSRKKANPPKYYLGVKGRKGEILTLKNPPTKKSHGHRFTKVHGPFGTKQACRDHAKTI